MFDSPFDFCPHCGEIVLLDQTQIECAREHQCDPKQVCGLQNLFTGIDFSMPQKKEPTHDQV